VSARWPREIVAPMKAPRRAFHSRVEIARPGSSWNLAVDHTFRAVRRMALSARGKQEAT
jgi:hypothetical protein